MPQTTLAFPRRLKIIRFLPEAGWKVADGFVLTLLGVDRKSHAHLAPLPRCGIVFARLSGGWRYDLRLLSVNPLGF